MILYCYISHHPLLKICLIVFLSITQWYLFQEFSPTFHHSHQYKTIRLIHPLIAFLPRQFLCRDYDVRRKYLKHIRNLKQEPDVDRPRFSCALYTQKCSQGQVKQDDSANRNKKRHWFIVLGVHPEFPALP